jgi:hypothetical protein
MTFRDIYCSRASVKMAASVTQARSHDRLPRNEEHHGIDNQALPYEGLGVGFWREHGDYTLQYGNGSRKCSESSFEAGRFGVFFLTTS